MTTKSKRKSFAKALGEKVGEIPQNQPQDTPTGEQSAHIVESAQAPTATQPQPEAPEPVRFNKFTFPLREDLHRQLSKAVARLNLEKDIEVSMAILIRLGIEHVLTQLEAAPDTLLEDLYRLEQKEVELSGNKRYATNRGLAEYIQQTV